MDPLSTPKILSRGTFSNMPSTWEYITIEMHLRYIDVFWALMSQITENSISGPLYIQMHIQINSKANTKAPHYGPF